MLLSSADVSVISMEISNFRYIEKYIYRLRLMHNLSLSYHSFSSLKVILTNMVAILIMSAKLATLGLAYLK